METKDLTQEKIAELLKRHNVTKPIAFFDLETTGKDVGKDRICSIAVTKIMLDGTKVSKSILLNPVIPISAEASAIHGMTNESLMDKPKFSQIAKSLYDFIGNCHIGGYNNNHFDNPILQDEFARCEINFPTYDHVSIDAYGIYTHFERRDLTAALKFYCGKEMENAHNAQADIDATVDIFLAQLQRYDEFKDKTIEEVAKIGRNANAVDWQGRILLDGDGDYVWNFGNNSKGKKIKNEMGFGEWVLKNDFPEAFKALVRSIMQNINGKT